MNEQQEKEKTNEVSEHEIAKRAQKITSWLKKPRHAALLAILVLAVALRLYYLFLTQGQAAWWDEAEYLATAKKWAAGVPYDLNPQRPPLFQALETGAFLFGGGEGFIKLFLVGVPSILFVILVYVLGKEMYDEKRGLIAAFLAAVSWTLLFWSSRIQPDFASLVFQLLSILFMWRYWKRQGLKIPERAQEPHGFLTSPAMKLAVLAGVFAALGFYFKVSALLVPLAFGVFILLREQGKAFKKKNYYAFAGAFLLTLVPYVLWSSLTFGTPIAFKQGYSGGVEAQLPFGWYTLDYFSMLTTPGIALFNFPTAHSPGGAANIGALFSTPHLFVLFLLFVIGLVLALKFVLYFDLLLKDEKKSLDPNVFGVVMLMIVAAFYIFYIRGAEDRWVLLWLPFMFYFIGNASLFLYDWLVRYGKGLAVIVVAVLLLYGAYIQYQNADGLVHSKLGSYGPVKDAGIWMKEHSYPDDTIFSISYTQTTYYAERKVITYSQVADVQAFEKLLDEKKPRYLQVSVFETHPPWIFNWVQNQTHAQPVQAYFLNKEGTQAALVVYEFEY